MGLRAMPDSIAALATAGATLSINRGSVGFGMMYSRPKRKLFTLKAIFTSSGTGSLASCANATEAANFISSLISPARTSKAPLKM